MVKKLIPYVLAAGLLGFISGLNNNSPNLQDRNQIRTGKGVNLDKIVDGTESFQNLEIPKNQSQTPDPYRMSEEERLIATMRYIEGFEGKRHYAYPDTGNNLTIGIGHHLTRDSRAIFSGLFPNLDFDKLIQKEVGLTEDQIKTLFDYDFARQHQKVMETIPNYSDLPEEAKIALDDMGFRTDLFKSPRVCEYVRAGRIRDAAIEYIHNSPEYQRALRSNRGGIVERRMSNQRLLIEAANKMENVSRDK